MINILIVEDDEPKLNQLIELLGDLEEIDFVDARSLNSATRILDEAKFDFVILDMSLPTFDGSRTGNASGRQKTLGGDNLMMYMKEMQMTSKVIVLTQWKDFPGDDGLISVESLDSIFANKYPVLYTGYVHFSHSSDNWKSDLIKLLEIE